MSEELLSMTRDAYNVVARNYAILLPDVSAEAPLDLAMIEQLLSELGPADASLTRVTEPDACSPTSPR